MIFTEEMLQSMKKVEAARAANINYEPPRMTAEEKEAFLDSFSYFNQKKNLTYKFYDVFNSQTSDYNKEYMEISVVFKDFPIKSRWHIASGLLKDGGIILGNSENNQLGICDGATFINENLWIQNVRNWVKAFD